MPAVPLPVAIEEKLEDLAVEVRRLRVLRGVSWFAAVLFLLPVVAVLSDVIGNLSGLARGVILAGCGLTAVLAFWLLVVRRMRGEIPPAELAAAIETEYPNLAERLQTLVELSENAEPGNGSKAMIALLAKDTEKRAKRMNFMKAAPFGLSMRMAVFAVLVAIAAVVPLFVVRGASERVRRALLPWYQPPVDVPYTVKVSSGNPVVKRGEPVTLSAYLERTKPAGDLPTAAALVYRTPGSEEKRLPMSGDDKAAFTVTRPKVDATFEYRVECGPVQSEWFTVSAVDPIEVTDGTKITISPPEYARDAVTEVKKDGLSEIEALQHSVVRFEFKFTRPPADAHFEFRPSDAKADQAATNLNAKLVYSGDRTTATALVPLTADGTLKLTLYGEKGVRTDVPVAVRAVPDAAPRFERAGGVPTKDVEVRPDAVLPFDLAVADDVAVGQAFVDFVAAESPAGQFASEPLALPSGQKRIEGKAAFSLAGRVKLGDSLRIRVRVQDTRSIPALTLKPNETTSPASGWVTLKVTANARPLIEQDIVAQKEGMRAKLDEVAKQVQKAADEVANLTKKLQGAPDLTDDQANEVALNGERSHKAAGQLFDLAKDADVVPELRPLAKAAREVAGDPLAAAEDELRKARTGKDAKARDESLAKADKALADAVERLKKLRQANEDGANARLDRARLEELAEEQKRLADDVAKADPKKLKELEAKQKELAERLEKLKKDSDALQKAQAEADRQRANQLADDLKNLADRQRELDDAVNKSTDTARREHLDGLKKLQKDLNDQAAKLADKTDTGARVSDAKPLEKQPFDNALDRLDKKEPVDAMTEQEKAARELDRLADALADKVKARGDAKAAAEQIARWQQDLNRRAADAAKQNPNGLSKEEKDKFAAEQQAIRKATERLGLPKSPELEQMRGTAADKAGDAADKLQRDPKNAESAMKKAADALNDLARQTPSNKDRRAAAKTEVEKLRREQEQIQKDAENAARAVKQNPDDKQARDELAKKLADAATKQDELAKKVRDLDTPGLEARRDRTADAGKHAAEDMKGGLPQDVPSSQADAKRQLDRLRDALDGQTPADEKAAELARLQSELTRNLTKAQKPEELQRLQRQQQDIAEQMAKLQAPEAAGQLADAQAAAKAAERAAAKPKPDVDELRKKSKEASESLDKLADRMNGGESPEKRLDRLAENRQAEANKAKDAENSRGDLSRTRDAQKQTERDQADLNNTRTGNAQAAKRKLQDALDKLNQNPEPDKARDLQEQAADAARKLADAVKKNGDRKGGDQQTQKSNPDPADANDPANALPTEKDVAQARDLAQKQRELRNDVAKSQERSAKGTPMPQAGGDPLGDLAKEQAEVAKQAGELAKQEAGDAAGQPSADAAKAAKQAADKLAAGDPADAKKAGADAAQKLRDTAAATPNPDAKKKADELAKKQDELNKKAEQADNAAATARQKNRQGELAQDAKKLGEQLSKAAGEGDPNAKESKNLEQAGDAAKEATKQMEQADRSDKNGKPKDAADARRQAEKSLDDASRAARGESKPSDPNAKPQPSEGNAKAAADATKQADQQMKQAQGQMGKGDGKGAAEAGQKAADQLKQAADQLAKAGQGEGEGQGEGQGEGEDSKDGKPGKQGGKNKPGQGAFGASGEIPAVVFENLGKSWGELPGEVKAKITAELKAKYGEDYARVIKLYFEQLAERK